MKMLFKRPALEVTEQGLYDTESAAQLYWIKYLAMVCYIADKEFYQRVTYLFRRGLITRMEMIEKIIAHVYIELELVV